MILKSEDILKCGCLMTRTKYARRFYIVNNKLLLDLYIIDLTKKFDAIHLQYKDIDPEHVSRIAKTQYIQSKRQQRTDPSKYFGYKLMTIDQFVEKYGLDLPF